MQAGPLFKEIISGLFTSFDSFALTGARKTPTTTCKITPNIKTLQNIYKTTRLGT